MLWTTYSQTWPPWESILVSQFLLSKFFFVYFCWNNPLPFFFSLLSSLHPFYFIHHGVPSCGSAPASSESLPHLWPLSTQCCFVRSLVTRTLRRLRHVMGNMCLSLALAISPRGAPARAEMGVLSVEPGSWWGEKIWSQRRRQLGCFLLFAPRSVGFHTKMIVANGGFCWGGGGIVGQQLLWQAAQTKGSKGDINGFFGRWQQQNDGKTTPRSEPQPATALHIFLSKRKTQEGAEEDTERLGNHQGCKIMFWWIILIKKKSGHQDSAWMVHDIDHAPNPWDSWPRSSLLFLLGDFICALLDKAEPAEKVVPAQGCQAQRRWGLLQWLNLLITSASSFYFSGVPARNTVQSNQDPDPTVISKIWVWLGPIWDQTPE